MRRAILICTLLVLAWTLARDMRQPASAPVVIRYCAHPNRNFPMLPCSVFENLGERRAA